MKTSVVLLALATAALAAPALHEETFEDVHIPAKFLDAFTRERKSTPDSDSSQSPGSPVNLPSSQVSELGVSGRSFLLKKPIIIKKKPGLSYQVYRDSDEEKLDSPVPCRKQVRVNLCDEQSIAKSADMMSSSTIENSNIHTTEQDMKNSIVLAKEAVENLQKDMKKIEHKPTKSAPWEHGNSESDAELHQDIEKARQALEHIQNNFEDMENPKTQTSLKDAEIVEDVTVPLEKTEEERLAQWKNAIESIQRNVELVRNIEESFKSIHDGMPHIEETSSKEIDKHEPFVKKDMRITDNEELKQHGSTIEDLQHSKLDKSSEHSEMKTDLNQQDMMESASMVSSSKLQSLAHNKAKDAHEKLHNGKDSVDTMTVDQLPQNMDILALKLAEETKEKKTENDVERTEKVGESTGLEEWFLKNQRDADKEHHETMTFKHGDQQIKQAEAAEHIVDQRKELIKDEDTTHNEHHALEQLKQAGNFATQVTQHLTEIKTHENKVHKDLVERKAAMHENSMTPDFSAIDQHKVGIPEMKSAKDSKNMQHQIDHSHMRWAQHKQWAQDKQFNSDMGLMKTATETRQTIDHMQKMHDGHHHTHQHANPHHLNAPNHGHLRQHEHFMTHGKSADMDAMQANYFMNMRDSENMGQEGQRLKWKPAHPHHHESARTAYGAPVLASAPASGAVGLFPNANVGSCGIPLLLSCNPSVVSGSLAKAHPAPYSAPSYRTEDDFNFHSKRDVKKTEKLVSTPNRTPTNTILKTSSTLVTKN